MKALPIAFLAGALTAAGALVAARHGSAAPVDWSRAQAVDVRMVEYAFIPSALRLRRGVPYRLHLVNAGKEGHDFTAADFFAAVEVHNRDALDERGASIYLRPGATADIYFIAHAAGLFAPRCADHDWAGMIATIVVD
jgi:plastocyanin